MRRSRVWTSRFLPWMHPGMEILLAHAEGERFPEIEAHLARCSSCRATVERLCLSIAKAHLGAEASLAALVRETFAELDVRMRAGAKRGRSRRLAEFLELYFGKEAAGRVGLELCGSGLNGSDTAVTTVSLFQAFLGRRAANAVAHQISSASV